jgi:nicotinate dehydrogenase subunit A
MSNVTLHVNGAIHAMDIDPSTRLLYVLRNDLGLRGPRFGCGLGQCGACTVIIDGVATRSCVTRASRVSGEHDGAIFQERSLGAKSSFPLPSAGA